ncbi:MAG: hypothetical protein IJU23_04090 [Proteobacteria bacterium]|nr:hypothetical protein [Pseudomonadota bacterium]
MNRKFALFCTCLGLAIASSGCHDDGDQISLECPTAGETRCENDILLMCKDDIWTAITTCPNGCDGTTCASLMPQTGECTVTTCKNSTTLTICSSDFKATDVACGEGKTCIIDSCYPNGSVTNCSDKEHSFANQCEADDLNHCGSHTNDCTRISGWKTGSCYDKRCIAEECAPGYHRAPFIDSNNKEAMTCEEDESCKPGEVLCPGSCINPNTNKEFCGADPSCSSYIPCSDFEDCVEGKCVQSSCPHEGESICTINEQNLCINIHGDDPNHCGACGASCSDTETAKTDGCSDGKCIYFCKENLINCGSDTEPLCLSPDQLKSDPLHCGKCNAKCKNNELCQDGKCIVNSCKNNECLYNNSCTNHKEHCGTQCINCNTANHAATGICEENGTCRITSCATDYHLTPEGTCAIDSATACPNGKSSGTVNCNTIDQYTKAGNCVKGFCQATECQANTHLKDGKCIADTLTNCGVSEVNCSQLAGWKTGKCENGKCVSTTCKSGFCLNSLQNQCTSVQSSSTCGTHGGDCQACNPKQVCSAGSCVDKQCEGNVCNQTQVTDETLVCKNDNTHCGPDCLNCNSFTSNVTDGTCNTNGSCQVTACKPGFHIYSNTCEEDSTTNCGSHGIHCNVANANNACVSKSCTFTCQSHFHPYNNTCVEDSDAHCGVHDNACIAPEYCLAGRCTKTKIGDIITFGRYEQDSYSGKDPIEWRVLDIDSDGHFLVISDKILESMEYNRERVSITWEKSTIRSWLNGYDASYNTYGIDHSYCQDCSFINGSFTVEEKAKIIASNVPAHANPNYDIDPGNATTDKIFLLSVVEAHHYFPSDEDLKAYVTYYPLTKYAAVIMSYNSNVRCTTSNFQENKCVASWWLRSPGKTAISAATISSASNQTDSYYNVDTDYSGVRPAMWINY